MVSLDVSWGGKGLSYADQFLFSRGDARLSVPSVAAGHEKASFLVVVPQLWNIIHKDIHLAPFLVGFKRQ